MGTRGQSGYILAESSLSAQGIVTSVHESTYSAGSILQHKAGLQEGRASRVALCPVHMLKQYILRIASWRIADQLFVCFGPGKKGAPLSKQRLAHWVADSIVEAYCATGCVLPATVKCHST